MNHGSQRMQRVNKLSYYFVFILTLANVLWVVSVYQVADLVETI